MRTFVIVGSGVAGTTAALTLRTAGFDGRVVLVGDEPREPYPRPPLSKDVLRGETRPEQLRLRPPGFYAKRQVEILAGVSVTELDPAGRTVLLDDGSRLSYDRLLLATGGRARTLAQATGLAGVHTLRSLADAEALRADLRPGRSVLVVGAGFIGAEVAASARTVGCEVTMLEAAPAPLGRVLPPQLARLYIDIHRSHGVDLHTGVGIDRLQQDGSGLLAVATDGRSFAADVVVLGLGMSPEVTLAERAGLAVDNGIVVDEFCATSHPDIYAAGDVANAPDLLLGGRHRVEHWQHAQHQGATAARNMLGQREAFTEVPWCWSDQFDVNLQVCGAPAAWDEVWVRGALDSLNFVAIFARGGLLRGAVGINRGEDVRALRRLIQHAPRTDARLLADSSTDLAELASAAAA